jgi:hypothetical protein
MYEVTCDILTFWTGHGGLSGGVLASDASLPIAAGDSVSTFADTEPCWGLYCLLAPAVIAPLLVIVLRPLFAMFVRESAALYAHRRVPKSLAEAAGHYLAAFNVIVFIGIWAAAFACHLAGAPSAVTITLSVTGVVGAFIATICVVGALPGIKGLAVYLVGVVTFGGGNLPLIVVVPTLFLLF